MPEDPGDHKEKSNNLSHLAAPVSALWADLGPAAGREILGTAAGRLLDMRYAFGREGGIQYVR